ncbi:ABC transporter ATP-binding protein [Pseudonocardia sp. McavD-2-B]|uniref:ABC transporter ATP-binding protein n=1 Tax=Pseudonocardia sp. McavD-2-B TaxID=2954499 RepID=UPI00209840D5|nr:oligopeptide/dipeptide ABC transporter ATP-binding protein [Pseudonocardia sp. McavD-2-B]MCO7193898.1 ABC transporter ATP-binding protein [Pseudonocardia sp. McavD-2-B]
MNPVLDVRDLRVEFPTAAGALGVVDGVSFDVGPGETVALVGESGSGKSVSSLAVLGLLGRGRIAGGSVSFRGEEIAGAGPERLRRLRGAEIAMVFQNPMSALDPLFSVGDQVVEAIRVHRPVGRAQARERAVELLREVGLPDPERRMRSYPHELSGGQQQRVGVAMALACDPELLIADEPTTALDVTVEAQILALMRRLQREHGAALLLITHDMSVVARMADRVVVMYAGQVVERGTVAEVLSAPTHPYTRALIGSVPTVHTGRDELLTVIPGSVPNPADVPDGCRFHPRCPQAVERCRTEVPPVVRTGEGRISRCWLAEDADRVPAPTAAPGTGAR